MRIGMLMTPSWTSRRSPLMPEVLGLLRQWGASVEVLYPEDRCTVLSGLKVEHDLYVLKTDTELGLSVAGALHAVGAPILNPWPAAVMMKDKIAAMRSLLHAGVPIPETYVISSPQRLARRLCAYCKKRTVLKVDRLQGAGFFDAAFDIEAFERLTEIPFDDYLADPEIILR